MARVRIIPGAPSSDGVRGLLLHEGAALPSLTLEPDGVVLPLVPAAPSAPMAACLGRVRLATFHLRGLAPGRTLRLVARSQGEEAQAEVGTLDPAAGTLRVVLASCFYEYFHRGWAYEAALLGEYARGAAFKVLAGDNLYLDVHPAQRAFHEAYAETAHVYLEYFWRSEAYARVLAHGHTLTTWDDHEFWNDYPERVKFLTRTHGSNYASYREAGREAVRLFQACLNPAALPGAGLSTRLSDGPLVDWFVADLRYDRERRGGRLAPAGTLAAVRAWALGLTRPGVLVLGQPLFLGPGGSFDATPANFAADYEALWRALEAAPYEVLMLSGDVHHSRATQLSLPGARRAFEIVSSPAAHIPTVASTVTGSLSAQDRGAVRAPSGVRYGGASAQLSEFFFGTDVPNSIAVLDFRAAGGGVVEVGAAFLDLAHPAGPRPAPSVPSAGGKPRVHALCRHPALFELRRR